MTGLERDFNQFSRCKRVYPRVTFCNIIAAIAKDKAIGLECLTISTK